MERGTFMSFRKITPAKPDRNAGPRRPQPGPRAPRAPRRPIGG
ncbi:hypothetical protein [Streptomyces sp. NPDC005322]